MSKRVKVYLASRFTSRKRLLGVREILESNNFKVTSRWLNCSDERPIPGTSEWREFCILHACEDADDIMSAHILVLDLLDGHGTRSGEWVELGITLGTILTGTIYKYCIVVGSTDNVFSFHPLIRRVNDWDEAYMELQEIQKQMQKDWVNVCRFG